VDIINDRPPSATNEGAHCASQTLAARQRERKMKMH